MALAPLRAGCVNTAEKTLRERHGEGGEKQNEESIGDGSRTESNISISCSVRAMGE